MSALSKIINAGFAVTLDGDGFEITPASALTMQQREFLTAHKAEIVRELQARQSSDGLIKCGNCRRFLCLNKHGKGAGLCLGGVEHYGHYLWSETERRCAKFD
jgi:hypothetical protein